MGNEKTNIIKELKKTIKNDKVICALSGGVDSSVVAILINKAVKKLDLFDGRYGAIKKE